MQKLISILITILILSLAACGGDAATPTAPPATSPPEPSDLRATETALAETAPTAIDTAAPTATPTPAPTSTPAPTDTPRPTDTPEPTRTPRPTATATPQPVGQSPANPIPPGATVPAPGWEIQVLELLRGDEAWQRIQDANPFNDPPRAGHEYLLVRIHARSTAGDDEAHAIDAGSFRVVGSRRIQYAVPILVEPEPALDAELYQGGETEGWIVLQVGQEEDNLILVFRDWMSFEEQDTRYIALEPGASLPVPEGLSEIEPGDGGTTRREPVPLGETVTTQNWEITALEYVRGDEAWTRLQAANQFNELPLEGLEYALVRVHARYIGTENKAVNIDDASFNSTGDANILYLIPSVVEPEPHLDADLLPGGEYEGWVTVLAGQGETDLQLVFEPWLSFDDEELRFMALEEGASIQVPEGLVEIAPTDLGVARDDPVPLGETATTENWQITVLEAVRGDEAWTRLQAANEYNDPPAEGLEYVLARMRARYIGTEDEAASISGASFSSTGDAGVVYDNPMVVEPEPSLDAYLFPGGSYEGWIALPAAQDETGLLIVFEPWLGFDDQEERFFALE